jgi:hypothetical protein
VNSYSTIPADDELAEDSDDASNESELELDDELELDEREDDELELGMARSR